MTQEQKESFTLLISSFDFDEFHHGLCIGADTEAHEIVRSLKPDVMIVGHPPTNKSKMSKLIVDERRKPYGYLQRNSNIIHGTRRMLAVPRGNEIPDLSRSGTEWTCRKAIEAHKPLTVIWPTGDIDEL
jgi:hypothetical protein